MAFETDGHVYPSMIPARLHSWLGLTSHFREDQDIIKAT